MNLERRIRRLNSLLADELGGSPAYAWFASDHEALNMRYMMFHRPSNQEEAKNPKGVYDYFCACGKNAVIHRPWCKSLVVPRPRSYVQNQLEGTPYRHGYWVVAAQVPIDRASYLATWKTLDSYKPAQWIAVARTEPHPETGVNQTRGVIAVAHEPTIDDTQTVIRLLREHRTRTSKQVIAEVAERRERLEDKMHDYRVDFLRDQMSLNPIPGGKHTVSYPGENTYAGSNSNSSSSDGASKRRASAPAHPGA